MKLAIDIIDKFNEVRTEIGSRFTGLLHVHTALINSLITRANPLTGIVTDITYNDIANLLTVNKAPGRSESGTPQKQTLRSYLRSIEKQCPEDFKVISEGQKLQFQFPKLPAIYAKFLGTIEEYTVHSSKQYSSNTVKNPERNDDLEAINNTQEYSQQYTDQYIFDGNVKKIFINNKTNNNNSSMDVGMRNKNNSKTISQDFYPSPEILSRAIASGYDNGTDASIIQEFIDKNTAWGSTFADFNPVYLNFLAKHAQRKQQESMIPITHIRSRDNERASPKINSYAATMEAVRRHNQNAQEPSAKDLFQAGSSIQTKLEHKPHIMAMDGVSKNLRRTVP